MKRTPKQKPQRPHQLVGSWINGDEYASGVEYIVSRVGKGFVVRAIDRFDGEEGSVCDVCYDADKSTLTFKVLWKSTGRLINARLIAISPNRVSYTYTYTENEMWFRKGTEPATGAEPSPLPRLNRTSRTK
jgi:hypothetical protein